MKIFYKIVIRILLFVAFLFLLNFGYKKWMLESDLQKYSDVINLIRAVPVDAEILYIGESSNITTRPGEVDKRPISAMLEDFYPTKKMAEITKPAGHAGIYFALLKKIPKNYNVKTVIITVNLRSFNAQWIYSDLETQLQRSLVLLRNNPPIINRILLSFKASDNADLIEREQQIQHKWNKDVFHLPFSFPYKNVIEWDNAMAAKGIRNENGEYDHKLTQLACHYIKGYAFQIDTNTNIRIKDFDKIIQLAKQKNWNLVFNILPENTEKAKKMVGMDLYYFMVENAKILTDYFSKKGVTVINNLNLVASEEYIDQDWTTEHYAMVGRYQIAKSLAFTLRKFYPNNFVDANQDITSQYLFFHDFEKRKYWNQEVTRSQEKAFSGQYSSKVDKANEYSVTFEYSLNAIPDSLRENIDVSFKVFIPNLNCKAKLYITILKDDENIYNEPTLLTSQISEPKKWQSFSTSLKLESKMANADIIKVFVYNPEDDSVYIDDLKIEFGKK